MNAEQSYYAVIFSSQRSPQDDRGYGQMSEHMLALAKEQPGFLGIESARDQKGSGITVSYWKSLEDIASWKANAKHLVAQELGKSKWYDSFKVRICRVESEYGKKE